MLYSGSIITRLDDEEEIVTVDLNTQTKPVNDFAGIFKPREVKKITGLIMRLEKETGAEISVVSTDSLEGKTIEEYSNELFNEWGIGKEDRHNGLLFLINKSESKYRIEVGQFGAGVYKTLAWIASRITLDHRKQAKNL
jgi:uncharacterized protein